MALLPQWSANMNKLIFFVDDDKMILNLLEYTFQSREQYDVRTFHSGEECLASLDQDPELIVLDHFLAGGEDARLNGIETLVKIKEVNEDVPVIILTGHASDELLAEFMEKGASNFLTKDDYFIDSLIETIGEVLR